jgi:hypothetical protein
MDLVESPTYTGFVDQQLVIEPLHGPVPPGQYTDRFPDELYHKAPESHLIRFLHTLLGPSGVGWIRKQSFDARLELEAQSADGFSLDLFYGDPFGFGRIVDEMWDEDPTGLLPQDKWIELRNKDARYRSRAIDFFNAGRSGNTPLGMKLAARSGLGHEVEIIENYKYLFDSYSDDPIGLDYFGKTYLVNEMIVLPRQEDVRSEQQRLTLVGSPTGGNYVLSYNGQFTAPIGYDADQFEIESALRALPNIGPDGVSVIGGVDEWIVRFIGPLSQTNVYPLIPVTSFTGGDNPTIEVETITDGLAPFDEIVHISAQDQHHLQTAVDRIKSVTTIPTVGEATRLRRPQPWRAAFASSEYNQVVRYVTGQPGVLWPEVSLPEANWIERNVEKEAPKIRGDLQYHYTGFHNVNTIEASSSHTGRFSAPQRALTGFSYLSENTDDTLTFTSDRVLADYFEPLTVSSATDGGKQLINGIYPTHYMEQSGVPSIKYAEEQFWASDEATEGTEWLEIDLGVVTAVNFIAMEVSRKPINIEIALDVLDQEEPDYVAVVPVGAYPSSLTYEALEQNPWHYGEYRFEDNLGRVPYTRYVRLRFERDPTAPFLTDPTTNEAQPWSIEVRNLRIGRSVSDY